MSQPGQQLRTDILKAVSRSFYLTLRVLPRGVRPQIGLAYLLARATDTIADTELVPVDQRLEALEALRQRILGERRAPLLLDRLAQGQDNASERELLTRIEEALALLEQTPDADRRHIRNVLETITSGQTLDLRRFGSATGKNPVALNSDAELDDYTYRVAGCVGEFWTHLCLDHLFSTAALGREEFLDCGIRFGKGLQLTNILRDLPRDLRQGRCYVPKERLSSIGLQPAELLDPRQEARLRPLYDEYLAKAHEHLAAGWRYTNSIPFGQVRVRLACAWPVLIGIKTLAKLRTNPILAPDLRIKVTRSEVRSVLIGSIVRYPIPVAWRNQFR